MILRHYDFENVMDFSETRIYGLVFEDKNYMYKIVKELSSQIDGNNGNFFLTKELEEINISSNVYMLTDFFNLDFNSKPINNAILKNVQKVAIESEGKPSFEEVKIKINDYIKEILYEIDFPLTYEELDVEQLFKHINLKLNYENKSFVEELCSCLSLINQLFKIEIFVLVGAKSLLDSEAYNQFCAFAEYNDYKLVFIDSMDTKMKYKSENKIEIDIDKCEFLIQSKKV